MQQNQPDLMVTERQGPDQWLETRLRNLTDSFSVEEEQLTLAQVYQDVFSELAQIGSGTRA